MVRLNLTHTLKVSDNLEGALLLAHYRVHIGLKPYGQTPSGRMESERRYFYRPTPCQSPQLCATITSFVTPLGLYDALEPSGSQTLPFVYVQVNSPFGIATPSRSNLPFSRACSQLHGIGIHGPAPCPYSGTTVMLSWDCSSYTFEMLYGYNTTVPQIVRDIYSSGTRHLKTTVSNYFDIQWRQYCLKQDRYYNNGSDFV
jgi:hypothetical protein